MFQRDCDSPALNDLDDRALRQLVIHIVYEKDMWDWARARLEMDKEFSPERQLIQEAFLLHTRVLTEFFASRPSDDDVVATHFVPTWSSPDSEVLLGRGRRGMNKWLVHLTATRLHDASYREMLLIWNNGVIPLNETWHRFLGELTEDRRAWFDSEISRARLRHRRTNQSDRTRGGLDA